jgi:hypothetical protein
MHCLSDDHLKTAWRQIQLFPGHNIQWWHKPFTTAADSQGVYHNIRQMNYCGGYALPGFGGFMMV